MLECSPRIRTLARLSLVLALDATGCAPAGSAAARIGPASGAPDRICVAPPARTPMPPLRAWCQSPAAASIPGGYQRRIQYEYEPDEIHPEYRDPPAAALSAEGLPRHALTVRRQIEAQARTLGACYRWASGTAPAQPARLHAAFSVDPWGQVHDIVVTPDGPRSEPLARCLRDVLASLRLVPAVARRTRVSLVQRFRPSVPGARPAAASRPVPPRPARWPGRACLSGPPTLPEDRLDLGDTLAPVSDFDWLSACWKNEAEREAKALEKCRATGLPCRLHRRRCWDPHAAYWRVTVLPHTTALEIRRAFRRHRGDLQACYREALGRRPRLRGTITITARWISGGLPLETVVGGELAADAVLAECVRQVANRVSLPLLAHELAQQVIYPLRLIPDGLADEDPSPGLAGRSPLCLSPRRAEAHAGAALAERDGEEALRWLTALRAGRPSAGFRCRLAAQSVAAAVLVHPWESPTLDALLDGFVRDVRLAGAASARACWGDVTAALAPPLREALEADPTHYRLDRVEAAARRLGLLLGQSPPADWALEAAYARADALRRLGHLREAEAAFRGMVRAARGSLAKRAAEEAEDCARRAVQEESAR